MKVPGAAPGERGTLAAYRLLERIPLGLGRAVFSRGMRLAAPYFISIPASVVSAAPGRAEARMSDRPWVRNHLGTVHAIAICNLAEMTMGVVAEATVPTDQRWIPKGMTVSYEAKARGEMHAVAQLELPAEIGAGSEVGVPVTVTDPDGQVVVTAEIRIWITPG